MVKFTKHAQHKFRILRLHSFNISRKRVLDTIERPELIDYSRSPLLIVQRKLDQNHVLRVVFKEENSDKIIITFYPGRIKQYERKRKTKN